MKILTIRIIFFSFFFSFDHIFIFIYSKFFVRKIVDLRFHAKWTIQKRGKKNFENVFPLKFYLARGEKNNNL